MTESQEYLSLLEGLKHYCDWIDDDYTQQALAGNRLADRNIAHTVFDVLWRGKPDFPSNHGSELWLSL